VLVLEHRPLVVPAIAAAVVIGVITQTVEAAPTLGLGEWVAAGMGILAGSFISYLSALRTQIVFDSARGDVRWQHFGWPGRVRGSCPLAEVTGVQVLGGSSGDERVVLSTASGVIPLTRHFVGIGRPSLRRPKRAQARRRLVPPGATVAVPWSFTSGARS
jgi:hypothetical protein